MAAQEVKEAPPKEEMSVSVAGEDSARKVELDLDDAPFLKEEQAPPPAVAKEEPLPDTPAQEAPPQKPRKKKLLIILGALAGALAAAGAAAWWFLLRTPPPPPPEPVKPEVIVVPDPAPEAAAPALAVKEMAPFTIPRQSGEGSRFLVCKFSMLIGNPAVAAEIDHKMISLRDSLYFYLTSKDDQFLLDHANVGKIKKDLVAVLNDYLSAGKIEDIVFESYLNE